MQPTVFLTKVWGFSPEWPLVAFNREGNRTALLRQYKPGDWVVLVGTQAHPTMEEDQGRILGLVKVAATSPVNTLEVLAAIGTKESPESYTDSGSYRWPYGVPFIEAYSINDKPRLHDILPDRRRDWGTLEANQAVPLSIAEAAAILALQKTEVSLPDMPEAVLSQRRLQQRLEKNRENSGPPPFTGVYQGERTEGPAWVYVFSVASGLAASRFRGQVIKIGFSTDPHNRAAFLSDSIYRTLFDIPPMKVEFLQPCDSPEEAYRLEQELHKIFEDKRIAGEYFRLSPEKVQMEVARIVFGLEP